MPRCCSPARWRRDNLTSQQDRFLIAIKGVKSVSQAGTPCGLKPAARRTITDFVLVLRHSSNDGVRWVAWVPARRDLPVLIRSHAILKSRASAHYGCVIQLALYESTKPGGTREVFRRGSRVNIKPINPWASSPFRPLNCVLPDHSPRANNSNSTND